MVDGLVVLHTDFDMSNAMSCGSNSARNHQGSSSVRSAVGYLGDSSDLDFVHMALYMCSVFWHVGLTHCIIVAG